MSEMIFGVELNVGQGVYYRDNGTHDTGEIIEVKKENGRYFYLVKWDYSPTPDEETDWFTADQLAIAY